MSYNYYALHTHMQSGGVKVVVENIIRSFDYAKRAKATIFESGEGEEEYQSPRRVDHIKIPLIGDLDKSYNSKEELEEAAFDLMENIENKMDFSKFCVLHAHNVNLFFHSTLGLALKMLAERHPRKVLVLLQVHDFAEDNRPERIKLLNNCTGKEDIRLGRKLGFPLASNIIYLTINSRDKKIVRKTGIPFERIFHYPNSVHVKMLKQKPIKNKDLIDKIEKYAKENKYVFDRNRKILLYPVRLVQRKNVAEAILLLKLANYQRDEYQLIVTLDSDIPEEDKYANAIRNYVKRRKLPVVIGIGNELISPVGMRIENEKGEPLNTLADLLYHTHSIITTSTLEGFGFVFLEGWLAKKQIVGRRLSFVMKDFEAEGMKFPGFYSRIPIDGKDFPKYSIKKQLKILDTIDPEEMLERRPLRLLIRRIHTPSNPTIDRNRKLVEKNYSLRGYFRRLNTILRKGKKVMKKEVPQTSNKRVEEFFKKLNS